MDAQAWAIVVTVALALVGAVWLLFRAKVDRTENRLDEHIREDVTAHERLKAVETEVANLKVEVHSLRTRWHDLRSEITSTLASWYADIMDRVRK